MAGSHRRQQTLVWHCGCDTGLITFPSLRDSLSRKPRHRPPVCGTRAATSSFTSPCAAVSLAAPAPG